MNNKYRRITVCLCSFGALAQQRSPRLRPTKTGISEEGKMCELVCVSVEELGLPFDLTQKLKKRGISSFGDLRSKKNLETRGFSNEEITAISLRLMQCGAWLA